MNNYKIVIDAGHGGDDSGASGNGIIEKDLTLRISQQLYEQLRNLGIPVYMTRTTDETLTPSDRTDRILSAYGNDPNVIVVSNHINAGGGDGAEVIYALRNTSTLSNLILSELEKEGQNIRKAYQRRLPSDTSKDYYFIHRNTGITEPVIIEYGFLDSTEDDINQLKNNYKNYANAVARALSQYIGFNYSSDNTYTVKSGDSLWSIAKKYNTSVDELKVINNLSSNLLSIGQILKIPTDEVNNSEYKIYIVKSGDTLYGIASNNNISVNDIKLLNNLTSNNLQIGQQLKIPVLASNEENYVSYTVKSGDSLYKIANKYNVTVDELKTFNNLNTNLLSIGQVIRIPTKDVQDEILSADYIEYVVKSGDNLYAIANKYDISVDELIEYNSLPSTILSIGQIIRIPVIIELETYTVKAGDNLYQIAIKFNTTVDELKKKNNLTSNSLSIGQILLV